jgi:hypothetical protein
VALAELQLKIETDVSDIEERLKQSKAALRKVSEEDMPDLMIELGIRQFKLSNGRKVELKEDFYTKIPDGRFSEVADWLDARGYSGIIKSLVTAPFARGERERAEALVENLHEHGVYAELKQTIHPQTLKAFIRERLAAEEAVPFDLFGIAPFNKAVIS